MTGKVFTVLSIILLTTMGTPLPPNETANPCALCWGPGKAFGDGPTPKVINVALTRLLPGEHWNPDHEQLLLTTHQLEQQVGPCFWRIDDGTFTWTFEFTWIETQCEVRRKSDNKPVFVGDFPPPCMTDLGSSLLQPLGNVAYNGFANAYWNPEDL